MNYQVISRKYRPQKFEDVIGQQHISSTLKNTIKFNRISHGYLFTGSRGIGKTSTARIFAKALNCKNPIDNNPCNECVNCVEITRGTSLDVLEIDGASNRGINEIRELRENVKYPPSNSNFRIYIIDEVHMLTTEAFNALLKTLEEPPKHIIFIFATTEPHKIPDTIISRTQRYDFFRIPVSDIVLLLQKICEMEKVKVPEELLILIAKKADGGMRDSESLLDQVISFSGDNVNIDDAIKILGLIDYDFLFQIGNIIKTKAQDKLFQCANDIFDKGIEVGEFFSGLSEHFRNFLIANSTGSVDMLDLPNDIKKKYAIEAGKWDNGDLLRLINILTEAKINLRSTFNLRNSLEFCLLKMGMMDSTVNIQDILSTIGIKTLFTPNKKKVEIPVSKPLTLKKKTELNIVKEKPLKKLTKNSKPEPEKIQKKSNTEEISLDMVKEKWPEICEKLSETRASVAGFLRNGAPHKITGKTLEIAYHESAGFQQKNIQMKAALVEEFIQNKFNINLKIKTIISNKDSKKINDLNPINELADYIKDKMQGELIL